MGKRFFYIMLFVFAAGIQSICYGAAASAGGGGADGSGDSSALTGKEQTAKAIKQALTLLAYLCDQEGTIAPMSEEKVPALWREKVPGDHHFCAFWILTTATELLKFDTEKKLTHANLAYLYRGYVGKLRSGFSRINLSHERASELFSQINSSVNLADLGSSSPEMALLYVEMIRDYLLGLYTIRPIVLKRVYRYAESDDESDDLCYEDDFRRRIKFSMNRVMAFFLHAEYEPAMFMRAKWAAQCWEVKEDRLKIYDKKSFKWHGSYAASQLDMLAEKGFGPALRYRTWLKEQGLYIRKDDREKLWL